MEGPSKKTPNRPLFQINTTPEEWNAVARAADLAGIAPNTLARALFRWVFPLLASEDFDIRRLKEKYGEAGPILKTAQSDEEIVKDWMLRNLLHSVARDKIGVLRGMGKTSSVKVSPEVAHALERILAVRQSENDRTGTES